METKKLLPIEVENQKEMFGGWSWNSGDMWSEIPEVEIIVDRGGYDWGDFWRDFNPGNEYYPDYGGGGGSVGGNGYGGDNGDNKVDDPNNLLGGLKETIESKLQELRVLKIVGGESVDKLIKAHEDVIKIINNINENPSSYGDKIRIVIEDTDNDRSIDSGYITRDSEGYKIALDSRENLGLLVHELVHLEQIRTGKLAIGIDGTFSGYDINDEVEAYDLQHKIDKGIMYEYRDLTGDVVNGGYKVTAEQVFSEYPGIYDHLR